ncbi:peptidase M16 [Steroidobacter denitrificans]|uniref:Peptidase M16 n=1 Tax=Steroidobacter denitrificans TaxID=465721 RepID=A0A127FEA8_STEDE|nr:pitrilysin family protein [Steroidobacter denitrificans]AMN48181.1 peptidase M16 [Steroidobacter denitrificans]
MLHRLLLLAPLLLLAANSTADTPGQVPGAGLVEFAVLANGMRIIVWPDHDIPNVALYNWVRVGSRNEVPGITGLAHFFEHMMFNGTHTHAPGEFDRMLEANGARNNAYTSGDVTVYQDWFPRAALEPIFALEADRLRNLAFDPEVIESERGVVYSERRLRVEDSHFGKLQEQVQATAFLAHPYGIPTIGWPSDIESWTLRDLKTFFVTNYAPNNCTMVLVGDVDPDDVIALARKYFEPLPEQTPPPPVRTIEPVQRGERRVNVEVDAQTPLLQFAYHALAGSDERWPALDLLARILTDGDASRLYRSLIEEQKLAISVASHIEDGFDPGLAWFFLSLPAGGDLQKAEAAFTNEIERLIKQGVDTRELARARSQALADFWRGLATIDGKAQALGTYAVLRGGHEKLFDTPRLYEQVTSEDIRTLAAEFLRPTNRTVGVLKAGAPQEGRAP